VASVDEYGFGTALAPGATWIQPRWYAYEWDTPFAEVCRLAPKLVSAFALCDVLPMPKITDLDVTILNPAPGTRPGSIPDVAECGKFQIKVKYYIGITPTQDHELRLTGIISEDAIYLPDESTIRTVSSDSRRVNFEAVATYRMMNRLAGSDTAHTGQTTYTAQLIWADRVDTRRCEDGVTCIPVRNTISGTGPCP
jgi:hypothetical protein